MHHVYHGGALAPSSHAVLRWVVGPSSLLHVRYGCAEPSRAACGALFSVSTYLYRIRAFICKAMCDRLTSKPCLPPRSAIAVRPAGSHAGKARIVRPMHRSSTKPMIIDTSEMS